MIGGTLWYAVMLVIRVFKVPSSQDQVLQDRSILFFKTDNFSLFSVFAKTPKNTQAILRTYVTRLARPDARPQDIIYLNETIEGEVVPICISREKIVESTIEELIDACDERTVEALDTRLPLDVTFKLEGTNIIREYQRFVESLILL